MRKADINRDSSAKERREAIEKCRSELQKKRAARKAERTSVLVSCLKEQASDQDAFAKKYQNTKRAGKASRRSGKVQARPFHTCAKSKMQDLRKEKRSNKAADGKISPPLSRNNR